MNLLNLGFFGFWHEAGCGYVMLEGLLMLLMTAGCYMVLMLTLADWNVLSKVKSLIESSRTWTKEIQSDAWMVCHNGRLVLLSKQWPWHTDLRSPGRPCSKYIGEETIYIYIYSKHIIYKQYDTVCTSCVHGMYRDMLESRCQTD